MHQFATTVRAGTGKLAVGAAVAERAFVAADEGHRVLSERLVAAFAGVAHLEHVHPKEFFAAA
jgi:hypothetical protein